MGNKRNDIAFFYFRQIASGGKKTDSFNGCAILLFEHKLHVTFLFAKKTGGRNGNFFKQKEWFRIAEAKR